MAVNNLLVPILISIDFSNRFKKISENFNDFENRLAIDDFDNIEKVVLSYGYKFKLNKKENFFKLFEKINDYKIQFNIVIQRGIVEFIWGVEKGKERLKMGGSVCGAIESLTQQNFTAKPVFRNYEDLEAILKEAFSIYEDFKAELIRQEGMV
jgi:hypothetical protein